MCWGETEKKLIVYKLLYELHYSIYFNKISNISCTGIAFTNFVPKGTYDVIILDVFQPMGKKTFFLSNVNLKLELK